MASKKAKRYQQLLHEAEGYLDLVMTFSQRWPLPPAIRDPVLRRALRILNELDQGDANAHLLFLKGEAYLAMCDYSPAIAELEAAADLDPENTRIWLALGWCHKRQGRLDLAIQALNEAMEADDSEAIVHYNLACYWSLAGNLERALKYLERAIDIDPNYRDGVAAEPDFDPIRHHRAFRALVSAIA